MPSKLVQSPVCKGARPWRRIIQEPISGLNPEMLYRQIQYLVKEEGRSGQCQQVMQHQDAT